MMDATDKPIESREVRAARYRAKAAELRLAATKLDNQELRDELLSGARDWDELAAFAGKGIPS
ncbi:MAG: hypothetical protein AB7E79_08440 [Rhodospirillaceae bacterium]